MGKAMTSADWTARGVAYAEASEHLNLAWTDDATERAQGEIVMKLLEREAKKCHRIAADPHTPKQ